MEIIVDSSGQNQRLQFFCRWAEKRDMPVDVSLAGFGFGMINEDFHIIGI